MENQDKIKVESEWYMFNEGGMCVDCDFLVTDCINNQAIACETGGRFDNKSGNFKLVRKDYTKKQINEAIEKSRSQINNDSADVLSFISRLKTELKLYE